MFSFIFFPVINYNTYISYLLPILFEIFPDIIITFDIRCVMA